MRPPLSSTSQSITSPAIQHRLILFGRYPVPGETKTRLIPMLGPLGAADFQRRLTEKTLVTLLQSGVPAKAITFCHTRTNAKQLQRWLGGYGIEFKTQYGENLGARMHNAIGDTLKQNRCKTLLVGTDIPGLTPGHIQAAFDALDTCDVVLGPSTDGGYWLVGLKQDVNIFKGITWGGPDVLSQTLSSAHRQGLSTAQIDPLTDMDTPADLEAFYPQNAWRTPYLSVIIPTLNEALNIQAVIERVQNKDCEVIVTDGGSCDNTVPLARASGARVVAAARGRATQQNAGARIATGRVLLFLHADTLLPTDYGARIFKALMDPTAVAGAFGFKTDYDHWAMRLIEKAVQIRTTWFQLPYGDQAIFIPRNCFESIGGFPAVPIAEDLYLMRRLARQGRIVLATGAAVTSGRRWQNIGIWRTTLINILIAGGCLLGLDPRRLALLYGKRNPE